MAVDYAALKKGGFMRQKQKNNFSLRLQVVGGNLTAENLKKIAEVAEIWGWTCPSDIETECGDSICQA